MTSDLFDLVETNGHQCPVTTPPPPPTWAFDVVETLITDETKDKPKEKKTYVTIPRHPTICGETGDSCLCGLGQCQYLKNFPPKPRPVESVEELFEVGR